MLGAQRRPGEVLEALRLDWLPACHTGAVRALVDALQCCVDLAEHVRGVLLERVVDLAVDRVGRKVGEMVVAGTLCEVAGDVLSRAGILLLKVRDRGEDLAALVLKAGAEVLGVDLSAHLPTPVVQAAAPLRRRRCLPARRSCPGWKGRKRGSR